MKWKAGKEFEHFSTNMMQGQNEEHQLWGTAMVQAGAKVA